MPSFPTIPSQTTRGRERERNGWLWENPFPSIALFQASPKGIISHRSGEKTASQDEQRPPLSSRALPPHTPLFQCQQGLGIRSADLLLSSLPCVVNSFKLWKEWRQVTPTRARAEQQQGSGGRGATPTQSGGH